ncbi:hypothetical protein KVR01_009148 [Diaporthe batatas]|uniref:uncharacterized protein n=1 Tax=Diaporthe batatas TaxID=748121 RepID=UPI001D039E48|nr:uncharacterized protein KVR01_009148 [Diaporthe batatas]KAG8160884.1 hypothetical protein KVR01_009148 [Diaporthe batatas]
MPPKIVLKRGLNRVPTGGKSIKAPKKGPKKAPKSSKQRRASSSSLSSASLDLSDDGGYSGVDDVSDSDDDEENVFAAEEEHILANARQPAAPSSPRPTSSDIDGDEDEAAADADDDDDSDDNDNENEKELESADEDGGDTSSVSWNGFASENDEPVPAQVHTAEPEDVDDFFPDIFIAQDSLDSGFRREIEQDDDDDSSVSATYWDYSGAAGAPDDSDDDPYGIDEEFPNIFGPSSANEPHDAAHPKVAELPLPEDDDDESDGYMSDGETTEEDEPEPVPRKKMIPILRARSGDPSDSEKSEGGTPRPTKRPIKKPIKKPIVVMNPITRKMMVITPQKKQRKFDVMVDPGQFQPDYFSCPNSNQTSPIMGNPGSLMMSAMSSANFYAGGMIDFQTVGPAEAFFPSGAEPYMGDDSEDSWLVDAEHDDEDVEERNLNIEDFLDFGDGGSDGEDDVDNTEDGNTDRTPSRRSSMAPSALSDSNNDVHPLLSHLTNNADAVGAFRRNQVNQQLILNGQATQESLAFSNPLYHGTLRGIKHGSLGGAATPLTPERRHKKIMAKSPSEAILQKRKASGPAADVSQAHKRQRSISDVRTMHL